jgi:hypothetical protein
MVERKQPPPETFGTLAELGWKSFEAARKRRFAVWNSILKEKPKTNELRRICLLLMINPDLIDGRYAPYIYLILQRWLKENRPPKRPYTGKEIADLVDRIIDVETPPGELTTKAREKLATKARKYVANSLGMEFEAVKRNHNRYGRASRDKPR